MLIPSENEKDIKEIPPLVQRAVEIVLVDHMDEVLKQALVFDDSAGPFKPTAEMIPGEVFVPTTQPPAFASPIS